MPRNLATLAVNATQNVVQIVAGEFTFHLRNPIDLETRQERGHFTVAYPPLNIDVYGDTQAEAIEAFAEAFGDAWQYLNEGNLSRDASELKKAFDKLVATVDHTR